MVRSDAWHILLVALFFLAMGFVTLRYYDSIARSNDERLKEPTLWSRYTKFFLYDGSFSSEPQRLQAMLIGWLAIVVGLAMGVVSVVVLIHGSA
jgi:hypothetical protein